jgi:hypothetical protein
MQKISLNGTQLKIIAMLTMLIDHIGAAMLAPMLAAGVLSPEWSEIYRALRLIGRSSFPIYCFLLAEGAAHTRSMGHYALRLGTLAVLSEIPFDLAFHSTVLESGANNIYFTLLISLLMLWGVQIFSGQPENIRPWCIGGIALASMIAAELLHCDYGAAGVAAVLACFLLRRQPLWGGAVSVFVLMQLTGNPNQAAGFAIVPLLYCYNGQRGCGGTYGFYLFYPVHLLILAGITAAIL